MLTIDNIIKKIGILEKSEFFLDFKNFSWKEKIPYRLHKGLEKIKPDRFLLQRNKVVALFFDFSEKNNNTDKQLFEQIWNLGGIPIIFIIRESTLDIYNGFSFDVEKSIFDKLKIKDTEITSENFDQHFSIWDIFSGKSWEKLSLELKSKVDEELLLNLENTKDILEKNGLNEVYSQNIIGRLLFSRYLLDRKVNIDKEFFVDKKSFLNIIKDKTKLYKYFDYLKKNFNGDLFPVDEKEKKQISEVHLKILYELFSGSRITPEYVQKSLFESYNFEIIPIELISEVYERFMGKKKQADNGAYYTPVFIVDYVISKTVKRHLKNNKTCRVFDPSCGSGIFLVESLRQIIEKNLDKKRKINDKKLKKLVEDNIFGVDVDENAINLTAFSLCLTLLDYVEPKDITKFKFPSLKNNNLFWTDFFDENIENSKNDFNKIIKNIDFILGNPPWGSNKSERHKEYINKIKNENGFKASDILISDYQIAQSFLIRTKDFSEKNTNCALVLPSKILYNYQANVFRNFWLNKFYINEVLELSPVRDKIFKRPLKKSTSKKPVSPTTIVFYRYAHNKKTDNNVTTHTSVKPNIFLKYLNLLVIEKNDRKEIEQSCFIEHDWLWKIMLYGNVLDFNLIKKLKLSFDSSNTLIKKNNLISGVGLKRVDGLKRIETPSLQGIDFIDLQKKELKKFIVKTTSLWTEQFVGNVPQRNIFEPPYCLLKRGFIKKDFSLVSAYSEKKLVFTDSVTAIKGSKKDKEILKSMTGVMNSVLHNYFLLLQGSYAGVEREKALDKPERFEFPIVINKKISQKVDEIQNISRNIFSQSFYNKGLEDEKIILEKELNSIVLEVFNLNDLEKKLIRYAIDVSIPLINGFEEPIKPVTQKQLKNYAKILFDHFSTRWDGQDGNYFEIDIFFNNYVVGMNFKIVNKKSKNPIKIIDDKIQEDKLFKLIKLGEQKYTNKFFKQRDVRGFNKTSFYIVKPNQFKNWHEAIAHGDLMGFVEAILDAGKKHLINKQT